MWKERKGGKRTRSDMAVCNTTLVSSGVIPKMQAHGQTPAGWLLCLCMVTPRYTHPNVPQTCAACVSWKRAIRLPFQTELIS